MKYSNFCLFYYPQPNSFESFCDVNPSDFFILPPNSTWDYEKWMDQLCSLNVYDLMMELNKTTFALQLGKIVGAF